MGRVRLGQKTLVRLLGWLCLPDPNPEYSRLDRLDGLGQTVTIRWGRDGDVQYSMGTTRYDYEVRQYGLQAQALRWPVGKSGRPLNKTVYTGRDALKQAKAKCEEWENDVTNSG